MALDRPSSNGYRDGSAAVSHDTFRLTISESLRNVLDHRRLFLAVFLGCLLLATIYAITATPVYSVDTLIKVEENKHSALGSLSEISNALDIQSSSVVGEIDIARSRTVVTRAMDETLAQVDVSVRNPIPLIGGFVASLLRKDRNGLVVPLFNTPFWVWGGERVEFRKFDIPDAQIGKKLELDYLPGNRFVLRDSHGDEVLRGVVGKPSVANGYNVDVARIVARPGTEFRVRRESTQVRLDSILTKLSGAETKRQSGIMQLSLEDHDPVFAARLLNAIAAAYLDANARRRAEDAERSLAFLDRQLPVVKARLEQAEEALNTFRNAQGSIDPQGDVKLLIDQLSLVDKARLEAKLEYQDLSSKYVAGQPELAAVASKLKTLDQQSADLKNKVAHLPSQQQTYLRLAREVEVNSQLYVGLLNNSQQLQIAKAGTVGNASIIDKADVSDKPIRPKRVLVIALGAALGLILGLAATQASALFSRRVRDPKHLEAVVGVPMLGVLPAAPRALQTGAGDRPPFVVAREHRDTPLGEALENLALLLHYRLTAQHENSKAVLMTSPEPGQGTSTIAANLAYLFAESGFKTLLLRADAGDVGTGRTLPMKYEKGLSDLLKGTLELKRAISPINDHLDVLSAGKGVEPLRNLFRTERLEALIASLRDEYDMIVVDAPSARAVANVAMLSRFVDVTLMTARQGAVTYVAVAEAVENLSKVGAQVDGLVFNGFESPSLSRDSYASAHRSTKDSPPREDAGEAVPGTLLARTGSD
ncbi:Wzz/FepE/Etk N-terminal domain-containing protein [Burkholderia multivorans]|uniref:GNVR domain-containing protein n=1 Tax=Burkholderia multivorans TaxID=87883 RepID=UPI00201A09DE|nr:GNVR domain-containing protein [Burkholderia multivorans]MCO1373364.1 Wzz/FepE/Etk N-terminal domain-containing protein [Burkholderia multivorans]MCO1455376.1 Wzz/FepE/Etk N-terminal domain-containing protein [Burkholderia multivorans]MCO1469929.1 Wzz/FepE/Etk N-terminal domain-containing protein [Burkholderia multivorans]UQO20423.1 Wzz/FepE/Etk N-terminal domain-containing protein [Burkholderia multivorans]UQO83514.1 Wzz/FepE/Etk N-terminal domain-containing protein [Burkholderia multivora